MENKPARFCQSCGMPMHKDPLHGGSENNGRKSVLYCSYCYQNGTFTFNGTVLEFQEFCRTKMRAQGHSAILSWLFTRGMRRLQRWKT